MHVTRWLYIVCLFSLLYGLTQTRDVYASEALVPELADRQSDTCNAFSFFESAGVPMSKHLVQMNDETSSLTDIVLTIPESMWIIFLPDGRTTTIRNLEPAKYEISWYDPRNLGPALYANKLMMKGGIDNAIGDAPNSVGLPWIAVVTKTPEPTKHVPSWLSLFK